MKRSGRNIWPELIGREIDADNEVENRNKDLVHIHS